MAGRNVVVNPKMQVPLEVESQSPFGGCVGRLWAEAQPGERHLFPDLWGRLGRRAT